MPKNSCSPRMKRFNKTILVFAFLCPLALAQTAFVRVNQVGYLPTQTKRAYLMSSASETGATFSVKNSSGTTVFSGPIGANGTNTAMRLVNSSPKCFRHASMSRCREASRP